MKKKFFLFVLSILSVCGLHAQYVAPSEGVFRIINVGYNAALMEKYETNTLHCTATIGDNNDFDQLWILKELETGYSIQNAYTGAYIQTGNTGTEVPYWTGTTARAFNITVGGSQKGYNIFDPTLGKQGLHSKGANGNVVRWVDCEASEWKFEKVEVSEEAMTLAQAEYAEYYRLKMEFENKCAELLANQDKFEKALAKYFEDAACTVLKEEFASASEEELHKALTADSLPTELIDMAIKVKTDKWAEPNEKPEKPGWDSAYAKKFRVQLIEPHSIAGEITEWIGHQGHTNMDNPTGLYANYRQVLYVMVEGEIKEGSELWATWLIGHDKMPNYNNGYGDRGMRLESGLNIVPIRNDGSALYFNYLVHTYDKMSRKFAHKLSNYDDLKIHVAGGYINGYYNVVGDELYKGDNDDDWVYYEERANLRNITILGRYEVLQFELNDVTHTETNDKGETSTWFHRGLAALFPEELPTQMPNSPAFTAPNQRINGIIEAWDRIFLSEKMTLGVASKAEVDSMNKLFPRWDATWTEKTEIYNYDDALYAFCDSLNDRDGDYGEYYNHRGVAFGTRTGYMYGSWDHSGYHINTTPDILTAIATKAGPTWGPAHEIGHQHQALYTLNGEKEVTNNTFANVAVWYMGMGTSRINATDGNLAHVYDNFKNGGFLLQNNIWALTHRYYHLWLYYHRAGNNTQFFPRLFELIRQKPMEGSYGSDSEMRPNDKGVMEKVNFQLTNGYRSYLHFYKLCCEAAQEDLTEFFRAYGCFVPVDGAFVGDYTNSKYYTTQEEIDKAIQEVKAKNYPVNNKILFINDCTPDITYRHDGKTPREYWDDAENDGYPTRNGVNAEVGCYVDYLKGTPITGDYVYALKDRKLTVSGGKGAVGFAIYNKEGEIQAFSNHHNFELNDSVAYHLVKGDYKVMAIAADDNDVEIALKGNPITGKYKFTLTDNRVHVSGGAHALGFIVYNKNGELQAFSGVPTFDVPEALSIQLIIGEAYIMACGIGGEEVAVDFDQIGLLRGALSSAKDYLAKCDETETKVGYFIPDSLISLQTLVLQAEKVLADTAKHNYGEWYLAVDSSVTALLANLDARIPFSPLGYYSIALSNNPSYSIAYDAAGLRTKDDDVKTNHTSQWEFVMSSEPGIYYLRNRSTSNYITLVKNGSRAKAASSDVEDAVPFKLVPGEPGEFLIQRADNENINLYNAALNYISGGASSASAWWSLTMMDGIPETSSNDKYVLYRIQCLDNGDYLSNNIGRFNKGRLAAGTSKSADDNNYWFYFVKGKETGKYRIYNHATMLPVTYSDGYYYVSKETDAPSEFSIRVSDDNNGLVITGADGDWDLAAGVYVGASTTEYSQFFLHKIGEVSDIEELYTPSLDNDVYYDLMGRPVKNPTSGIYIHNGKKVLK